VGMTAAEANQLLLNAGFNISITGARDYWKTGKTVVEQIPAAGATLPYGTVVTLRFAYDEIAE